MIFTINAFWFLGYRTYELGKYEAEDMGRIMHFCMNGKKYGSGWFATIEVRDKLYQLQNRSITARQSAGEDVIGCCIPAEVDCMNSLPGESILVQTKQELMSALRDIGFTDLPEPKLYFIVETGNG
jgi:hypothetical protein